MGQRAKLIVGTFMLFAVLSSAGPVRAAAVEPLAGGVLDRLTVPAAPAGDGRPQGQPLSIDPIAVPTPTAAQAGALALAGMIGWRATRRLAGRA